MYALRGKGKVKTDFGIKEAYKIYRERGGIFKYSLYSKLLRELNEAISTEIIQKSLEFNMPEQLGVIRIRKFHNNTAYKKKRPDWSETKKLWARLYPGKTLQELKSVKDKPLVRHLNEHTNGYIYEFKYEKKRAKFKNKSAYTFAPARSNKNLLATTSFNKDIKVDYYE